MIKFILGHVEILQSTLSVSSQEIFIPGRSRSFFSVEVDPYKTPLINMHMYRKQAIVLFVKPRHTIEARGFGQFSIQPVRPTYQWMIRPTGSFGETGELLPWYLQARMFADPESEITTGKARCRQTL